MRLYKALVRSILDFGMCLASPGHKGDVQNLEGGGGEMRVIKAEKKMRNKPYYKHLKELTLSTLVY